MPDDPMTIFGPLLSVCVSEGERRKGSEVLESVVLVMLGLGCSLVTTYLLSALGVLV
jgi:hypothetical protein